MSKLLMVPEPSLLHKAAACGDLHALTALLDAGMEVDFTLNNGFTALAWAASNRQLEAVHLLIGRGADVNAKGGVGRHVLLLAAWKEAGRGDKGIVRALLNAGADVNLTSSWGETALEGASFFTNGLGTVRLLLMWGADVNIADDRGWTPLMQAVCIGQAEIVHALLAYRPDLTARNADGLTARMIAAQSQKADRERLLTNAEGDNA